MSGGKFAVVDPWASQGGAPRGGELDGARAFVPLAQPERAEGKPAVVAIFRRYVENTRTTISRTNLVPEDLLIDVRGETAVVSFHLRSANAVGRRTFIFHKQDGRWLIVHSTHRASPPGGEPRCAPSARHGTLPAGPLDLP